MFTEVNAVRGAEVTSVLTTRNVTAVMPHIGAVAWTPQQLDAQAVEWGRQHAPEDVRFWRLPWLSDLRTCTGCPNHVLWQQCQYALWTRLWRAMRRAQGVSLPVP